MLDFKRISDIFHSTVADSMVDINFANQELGLPITDVVGYYLYLATIHKWHEIYEIYIYATPRQCMYVHNIYLCIFIGVKFTFFIDEFLCQEEKPALSSSFSLLNDLSATDALKLMEDLSSIEGNASSMEYDTDEAENYFLKDDGLERLRMLTSPIVITPNFCI